MMGFDAIVRVPGRSGVTYLGASGAQRDGFRLDGRGADGPGPLANFYLGLDFATSARGPVEIVFVRMERSQ